MRRLTAAAAAAPALLLLVACSPDAADFREEAEKYIESRDFSEDAGLLRFTVVECEEPESTAEDTRYECTATAEDDSQWLFEVEITGDSDLNVIIPPITLDEASSGSTVPDDSSPTTTSGAGPGSSTTTSAPTTTTTS